MQYRYRVEGKVEKSFILRGAYFAVGSTIEFCVTESELSFVKERCKLAKIVDLQKKVETPNPVSNVVKPHTTNSQRTIRYEQSNGTSKNKNTQ